MDPVTERMLEIAGAHDLVHGDIRARGMRPWAGNPLLKEVTRENTSGELATAVYLPHELELMVAVKNAGADEAELAFLHELKAEFAGTFEREGRAGVASVVDERAHYEARNTSMVRVVAHADQHVQDSHAVSTTTGDDHQGQLFQPRGEREPRE